MEVLSPEIGFSLFHFLVPPEWKATTAWSVGEEENNCSYLRKNTLLP